MQYLAASGNGFSRLDGWLPDRGTHSSGGWVGDALVSKRLDVRWAGGPGGSG